MRAIGFPFSILLCFFAVHTVSTQAFELHMAANLLSVHAKDTPLRDILAKFQEAGVKVAIDDRINPLISANFDDRDIGDGIKRLLADCDYALAWQSIEGPAGKMRRISEILVYKPGDRRTLTPLPMPPPSTIKSKTIQTNTIFCLKSEILLRLRAGTTLAQLNALLHETGTTVLDSIPALGLYRLHFPPNMDIADLLNRLSKNPTVARVEPNQVYQSLEPEKIPTPATASPSRKSLDGSLSPAVAILDSGFTPSATLENAVVACLDATAPDAPISDPVGHGTQMALIAAGLINPEGGNPALASESGSIIPIRTMSEQGFTSGYTLMQSMIFAIDQGARVINMSWGSETDSVFFNDAITYARERGAVAVAAAGNTPTGKPLYPAANPNVIAVAALGPDGNLWDQSNFGPFITLAAPSFANMPIGYNAPPGTYGGTSIAAAYTARVIARYFALHPTATPAEAIQSLKNALTQPANGTLHPEIRRLDSTAVTGYLKQ